MITIDLYLPSITSSISTNNAIRVQLTTPRMRSTTAYLSLFLLPTHALQIPSIFAPFYTPYTESLLLSNETLSSELELLKRDGNCPADFNSCSKFQNNAAACCTVGSFCTTDPAKNIACCPTGATCTGSVAIATGTTTGTGGGGAVFGATTTTSTGATPTITNAAQVSYVQNGFFPFPYIPTTYSNSAACNSAFNDCQSNYAACTGALAGNGGSGFGVTIVAPNGGVTAAPTIQSLGVASATSVCSSLSSAGCYGIVSANCAQFGSGTGDAFIAGNTKNAAPRATAGCYVRAGVMAGVGLGIAGQMV